MQRKQHVACNQYAWYTFWRRADRSLDDHLDQALGEIAAAGLNGYEPLITTPEQVEQLGALLAKHALAMRSLYVNSTLHLSEEVERSIEQVLAIAAAARPLGTRIIVTNPAPIRWGGTEAKDDEQLRVQADALNRLGRLLAQQGQVLAYHNHDAELRHAAREFHHMMVATDPEVVTLCLDPHWIYRGAGNSQVALFDVVELYGGRISELHLRQSVDGVWSETFGPGDIDYVRLASQLRVRERDIHLVLEQAVEAGSPLTCDAVTAHRRSRDSVHTIFASQAPSNQENSNGRSH